VLESFIQIFGIAGTYFSEFWQIQRKESIIPNLQESMQEKRRSI
jgi:hypothetical protein